MTIRHDDSQVRGEGADVGEERLAARAFRLPDRDAGGEGALLDGRCHEGGVRARGDPVGLADHRGDIDTGSEQGFEARDREGGRPEEEDTHHSSSSVSSGVGVRVSASPLCSFFHRETRSCRFIGLK